MQAEYPTLVDLAMEMGAGVKTMQLMRRLERKTALLEDIPWMDGDLPRVRPRRIRPTLMQVRSLRGSKWRHWRTWGR